MTDDIRTTTLGYTAQPDAKVQRVNRYKEMEERLLRELDKATMPKQHPTHDVYIIASAETTETDQRWLAIARTHFQEGFMALNRAVFQPQRIKLPEDDNARPHA